MRDQLVVAPARTGMVSVAPGEAYLIGNVEPPDGITISVAVSALPAAQAASLPVPEGA